MRGVRDFGYSRRILGHTGERGGKLARAGRRERQPVRAVVRAPGRRGGGQRDHLLVGRVPVCSESRPHCTRRSEGGFRCSWVTGT